VTVLPGPTELLPLLPDAIVDLQTEAGAARVGVTWRWSDTRVVTVRDVAVGADLGPSGPPVRTLDILPHAQSPAYDDSDWEVLAAADTYRRLGGGRVSFLWYRFAITLPAAVDGVPVQGCTAVLEMTVDDYAEVWVDGELPRALGDVGGGVVAGFNAPSRVVLTRAAHAGQQFSVAVFAFNGPVSASPRNYVWVRTATLSLFTAERARVGQDAALRVHDFGGLSATIGLTAALERLATGFTAPRAALWDAGGVLVSTPATGALYRWSAAGRVTLVRVTNGVPGAPAGHLREPGTGGLALDPQQRLLLCQRGHGRVLRVNAHGDTTVVLDCCDGLPLAPPWDVCARADGTVYVSAPGTVEPGDRGPRARGGGPPLATGVLGVGAAGAFVVDADMAAPHGLALSPDGRTLYAADGLAPRVMCWPLDSDGRARAPGRYLVDLSGLHDDGHAGGVEGLAVDSAGTVLACTSAGLWVLAPDGRPLGLLDLPEQPRGVTLGGDDGRTAFVTAGSSLYRLPLAPLPARPDPHPAPLHREETHP